MASEPAETGENGDRVTLTELAAKLGVSESTIRYRVRREQLTPPDADGRYHLEQARREWAATTPEGPKRGRKPGKTKLSTLGQTRGKSPDHRWRLARARREEYQVRKLSGELVNAREATDRVFNLARQLRDSWLNLPVREAPAIAARIGVDPLVLLGELERMIRAHLATQAAPEAFMLGGGGRSSL